VGGKFLYTRLIVFTAEYSSQSNRPFQHRQLAARHWRFFPFLRLACFGRLDSTMGSSPAARAASAPPFRSPTPKRERVEGAFYTAGTSARYHHDGGRYLRATRLPSAYEPRLKRKDIRPPITARHNTRFPVPHFCGLTPILAKTARAAKKMRMEQQTESFVGWTHGNYRDFA
jgi:hypothetical protein